MNHLLKLQGRHSDLGGGLSVRRLLPDARCRAVGPFVFFDHIGPVTLAAEADSDVGPHPHIGLATVTCMWWNFVSSERERIAAAAARWQAGGFDDVPSDLQRLDAPPWRG
ncbi:MAG: pirin family protein [Rubrivivax sp.]|nr:pirin family protein [Rubrivivax sp.]